MTSMLVQSAREAASSSMGVGPCPGSSSPDAMSRRSWAVAAASSRPSFFQLTTTGRSSPCCPSLPPRAAPAVDYGVCTGIPCAKRIDGAASPGAPPQARRAKESS
jgi:hypothetical protein